MPAPAKKKMPGFSQGVNENTGVRTIKMVAPICPNSAIEFTTTPEGRKIPKVDGNPDKQNCQLEGGKWWEKCEERQHDPYHSVRVWYSKEDQYDKDTGELTGSKTIRHEDVRTNFTQVALSIRINSGKGVGDAIRFKGYKRLGEMGYEEVCQFRNCQNPIDPNARSREFGDYCKPLHLQLVAADAQGIFLTQTDHGLADDQMVRIQRQRQKQLREAAAFAADG